MWRIVRPEDLGRMRVEGYDYGRSLLGMGMPRGSGNDCLVSEVNAIECADRDKKRAGKFGEVGNGMKKFHQDNDQRMTNDEGMTNDE